MNVKLVIELMSKAGWSAPDFVAALNSKIGIDLHLKRTDAEHITIEQAEAFLKSGGGLSNAQYDVAEAWVNNRLGNDGISGSHFPKPEKIQTLSMVRPPVIAPELEDAVVGGDTMPFKDVTNQRARNKYLGA